jgi:hypothetical protein
MDQTDLGNRMAVLMIAVSIVDRSQPLAWMMEAGAANIGFAKQKIILGRVLGLAIAGVCYLHELGHVDCDI